VKTKVIKLTNTVLRIGIVLLSLWFLYYHLIHKQGFTEFIRQLNPLTFGPTQQGLVFLVVLLMPFNLGLEAIKWKLLIDKLEKVKFNRAFTAVLSGISVSMLMPNRIGDYLGRVFILQKGSLIKGVLVTLIGSMSQLLTTLIAGCIAFAFSFHLFIDFDFSHSTGLTVGLLSLIFSILVFLLILFFNVGLVKFLAEAVFKGKSKKLLQYIAVFSEYKRIELLQILFLSVLRYFIFSYQFYLLILVFGFQCSYFEGMLLISLSYLFLTIIPTIALTELSVRGSVAIYIFGLYFAGNPDWVISGVNAVFGASSVLWLINIGIPAILGVIFVYRLRFVRKDDDAG
jgi:hypothetical protein